MLAELKRLSEGKKTSVPARWIADWAATWTKAGIATDETEQLERLYRLQDMRQE